MSFLHSYIFLALISGVSWGSEITPFALFEPVPYKRESRFYQYAISKVGVGAVGRFYDVDKAVKKELAPYNKDLEKYFPKPNELNNLVDSILKDIDENIVKGKINDDTVTAIYSHVGKNLISKMADRILETEGVKDSSARQMWVTKILEPFNACIGKSLDSQFDAKHCMKALTQGLVPNVGIGIVYELTKSNLTASLPISEQAIFNKTQVEEYQVCIKSFFPTPSPNNVKQCALSTMKIGVKKITEPKLDKTINTSSSSSQVATNIKDAVWPIFEKCVREVGASQSEPTPLAAQFSSCIDVLVQNTGVKIVSDKVNFNPSLQQTFSSAELKITGKEKAIQFKKCAQNLITKNIRKDGVIDTSSCENAITNDLVYLTVLKQFNQSAAEQIKGTTIDVGLLEKDGKTILDSCWKQTQTADQREACLRKSIIDFSKSVAEKRLEFSIPANLSTKKKIKTDSLARFQTCLESNMPQIISTEEHLSDKMDPCTVGLLQSATGTVVEESVIAALNENLGDKPNINLSTARLAIKDEVLNNYRDCAVKNKDLTPCTDQVTKEATLKIALAAGRASLTEQATKGTIPSEKYIATENDLKSCTSTLKTGDELSKHLDKCKQKFTIEIARELGIEKFNNTLRDLLGTKKLETSRTQTAIIFKKYNECLDNLYKNYQGINGCTDQLSRDGELVFKENMNDWMSSDQKDAATLAIKTQFIDFLPCLGALLPSSGNSETAKVEKDVTPLMEIVAKALAQYIEYSPENAKQDLDELINQFAKDLRETADTEVARKNIVDLLYKNGAFDQFLKSYVRKIVGDSFASMSDKDLPKHLKEALLAKENFDAIFQGAEGKKIKDEILHQLINPLFVEGKNDSSPEVSSKIADVSDKVTHLLINSPHFGEKIIASQVQGSLDNISAIKGLFVKVFYGGNALNWQHVRQTSAGQNAENYIKENIMTPKFKNITLSASEIKKRNDEAERLVGLAVKSYKEPKK